MVYMYFLSGKGSLQMEFGLSIQFSFYIVCTELTWC